MTLPIIINNISVSDKLIKQPIINNKYTLIKFAKMIIGTLLDLEAMSNNFKNLSLY